MSTKKTLPEAASPTVCSDLKTCFDDFASSAEQMAQKQPAKAAGIAFLAGLVLTILPVGRIVGGLLRLALALLRPGLFLLGALKLWEEFEKKRGDK